MCDFVNGERTVQAVRQQTITQTLNKQRTEDPQAYRINDVKQEYATMESQLLTHRRELYDMGRVKTMEPAVRQEPQQKTPPVSKLTDRQRKKVKDKRASNLKKAQKKKIPNATADTIPMMDAVQSYYKELKKHPIQVDGPSSDLDPNLFTPALQEDLVCSVDVKRAMRTLAVVKARAARWYDAEDNLREDLLQGDPERVADYLLDMRNKSCADDLEYALKQVLANNGVDFETGKALQEQKPAPEPMVLSQETAEYNDDGMMEMRAFRSGHETETVQRLTVVSREEMEQAIRNYKESVYSPEYDPQEEAEAFYRDELDEMIAQHKAESTGALAPEETKDLDFVFHYKALEDEYIELRNIIDSHPEEYARHKESIDKKYHDYVNAQKELTHYGERIFALQAKSYSFSKDGRVRKLLQGRASRLQQSDEVDQLASFATQQMMAIRFMLAGKPFPPGMEYMYRVMEEEEGISTEEYEAHKEDYAFFQELDEKQKANIRRMDPKEQREAILCCKKIRKYVDGVVVSIHQDERTATAANAAGEKSKDMRALRWLLHGAELNADGEPADAEQAQYLQEDAKLIDAYLSGDVEQMRPYLDKLVEEILSFPYLTVNIEKEMRERPVETWVLLNQNCYLQNVRSDYPAYFNALPEEVRERIGDVMELGTHCGGLANVATGAIGVDVNYGNIIDSVSVTDMFKETMQTQKVKLETERAKYREKYGA